MKNRSTEYRWQGLSGSTLKIIAIISMVLDHTALLLVHNKTAYFVMRQPIGRMAFPVFCFLLVEGFQKTGSRAKYAWRLFCFALLSELPFDLASQYSYSEYVLGEHQNVFFTLLLGLLMLWGIEFAGQYIKKFPLHCAAGTVIFGMTAYLAEKIVCSSYGAKGIVAILLLYLFRFTKWEQLLACGVAFIWEPWALLSLLPLGFYNGQRGLRAKLSFYMVYPVHLLLLYLLRLLGH